MQSVQYEAPTSLAQAAQTLSRVRWLSLFYFERSSGIKLDYDQGQSFW